MKFTYSSGMNFLKSGNVLKVEGTIAKIGTFIPEQDVVTRFDKNSLVMLKNSLVSNTPIWIVHNDAPGESNGRVSAGWATKYFLTEDGKELKFIGHLFEKQAIKDVITDRWEGTSIEANFKMNSNRVVVSGNVIGIAYTQNPAMKDTKTTNQLVNMKGVDNTVQIDEMIEAMSEDEAAILLSKLATKFPSLVTPSEGDNTEGVIEEGEISMTEGEIDPRDTKITELTAVIEGFKAKELEAKKLSFTSVCADLRKMGLKEPEKLVTGLDVDAQLNVLDQAKLSFAGVGLGADPIESPPGFIQEDQKPGSGFDDIIQRYDLSSKVAMIQDRSA